jgi:hypothetical protein
MSTLIDVILHQTARCSRTVFMLCHAMLFTIQQATSTATTASTTVVKKRASAAAPLLLTAVTGRPLAHGQCSVIVALGQCTWGTCSCILLHSIASTACDT